MASVLMNETHTPYYSFRDWDVNLTALDSVSRPKDSSEVPGFRLERVLS